MSKTTRKQSVPWWLAPTSYGIHSFFDGYYIVLIDCKLSHNARGERLTLYPGREIHVVVGPPVACYHVSMLFSICILTENPRHK